MAKGKMGVLGGFSASIATLITGFAFLFTLSKHDFCPSLGSRGHYNAVSSLFQPFLEKCQQYLIFHSYSSLPDGQSAGSTREKSGAALPPKRFQGGCTQARAASSGEGAGGTQSFSFPASRTFHHFFPVMIRRCRAYPSTEGGCTNEESAKNIMYGTGAGCFVRAFRLSYWP